MSFNTFKSQDLQSQSVHPHAGALLTARAASSAQGMAKIIRSHVKVKTVAIRTKHLQILKRFQLHRMRGCINLDYRYLTISLSAIPYLCIVCAFVFVYLCSFDYVQINEHVHIKWVRVYRYIEQSLILRSWIGIGEHRGRRSLGTSVPPMSRPGTFPASRPHLIWSLWNAPEMQDMMKLESLHAPHCCLKNAESSQLDGLPYW